MGVSYYKEVVQFSAHVCWKKDCNGNPISTFPPRYAFQIIFSALAPRLIISISRNVPNKDGALKHKCRTVKVLVQYSTVNYSKLQYI